MLSDARVYVRVFVFMCMHECVHARTFVCVYMHARARACVCVGVCVCVPDNYLGLYSIWVD